MRAQAEQDARTVLEEARDATDMIWQEAERERIGVEAETIRLETLRHRSLEQLGRVYGHLESVLPGSGSSRPPAPQRRAPGSPTSAPGTAPPPVTSPPATTPSSSPPVTTLAS